MKRFAPLLLVVLALAVPAVAFADGSTPTAPAQAPAAQQAHPIAKLRLELLRLRIQLVHLRYRVACHDRSSATCAQFTQKVVDRLTTVDQNVQAKLTQLGCSSTSTDRKCTVLSKVDQRLQQIVSKLSGPATAPSSSTSDESGLDQAANALGGLNG